MKPTKNSTKEFYFMRCSLLRHLLREGELKGYVVIFLGEKLHGRAVEGSDPLFVCKGSCLIRYPNWQWTSWKLEDYPTFATCPKHHQKEQLSGGQVGFPALWMLVNHPQLHSPVEDHLVATCLPCYLLWYLPSKWNQQWDNHKLAGILGNQQAGQLVLCDCLK